MRSLIENSESEDTLVIAENPLTSEKTLQDLLKKNTSNLDVVAKIARNANANIDTIFSAAGLLGDRSHEIFKNPALDLHLLENPNLFKTKIADDIFREPTEAERGHNSGLAALSQNPNIAPHFQKVLFDDPELHIHLSKNSNLHPDLAHSILSNDAYKGLNKKALVHNIAANNSNPDVLNNIYLKFNKNLNAPEHISLAKNPNLPVHLVNKYVEHFLNNTSHIPKDPSNTLGLVLGRKEIKNPYEIIKNIENKNSYERQFTPLRATVHILKNQNLTPKQLHILYNKHKNVMTQFENLYDFVLNNPAASNITKQQVLKDQEEHNNSLVYI